MTFEGPDEVRIFQAITIKAGLKLLKVGIKPNRGWTIKKALATAGSITKKTYRNKSEIDVAIKDLQSYVEEARIVRAQ
jgi:hypothetical protein